MTNAALVLDALGDGTRRQIFERIARRPRSVGELAEGLPVSRPAVSQHLRVLASAGLVRVRAEGTRRIYSADNTGLAALRGWLDKFWTETLDAFRDAAEAAARRERRR